MDKIKIQKRKGFRYFSYKLDLFSVNYVNFIITDNYEPVKKRFDLEFEVDSTSVACSIYDTEQNFVGIILTEKANLDSLVHECVHIAVGIMDHANIPITEENDEVLAYLVEKLFNIGKQLFA